MGEKTPYQQIEIPLDNSVRKREEKYENRISVR